ncbi:MAG: 4-hydroxythreonine-4-phosphate dehydrogenase PdxA [Desulfopila sp.]|jgi:4-hydroxythreonine-4-phosphate dehydrogenase|nr:4-hydroxythreonine-4-phosphate dehydrogenase PdxA [Desulfopila sp.]
MLLTGITMGCPVGIGPEIILKYFHSYKPDGTFSPVVIGDLEVLRRNALHFNISLRCVHWTPGEIPSPGTVPVYNVGNLPSDILRWGEPNRDTGTAMAKYIEHAVTLARQGKLSGITTCPISKAALQKAGYSYPGHTEMLADLVGENQFTMMLAGDRLRVTLVTIHCGLGAVSANLNTGLVLQRIILTHSSLCSDFNIAKPKIAVAGLNPHAGEDGLFGPEEREIILPAVQQARQCGLDIDGPFPPDTVFLKAISGEYDGVVCMYHDQGLIPFKLLHFRDGVNVTIGLSLVRTSVDHGTAYDIAGQGCATPDSLAAAVEMAAKIAQNRKSYNTNLA